MYKAIKDTVPSVKSAEFLTKTQSGKGLSYEQLKFYIIQDEADNDMGYNARAVFHTNRGVSKERYYGCDDVGHIHALEVMSKKVLQLQRFCIGYPRAYQILQKTRRRTW